MSALQMLCLDAAKLVDQGQFHAAIAVALSLPDICASLESPNGKSSRVRYADWFDSYVSDRYRNPFGGFQFLSGSDCYALRCAYLHQGSFDIVDQSARLALSRFRFIATPPSVSIHCNLIGSVLQLQVDKFVEDILLGVERWLKANRGNLVVEERIGAMGVVEKYQHGQSLRL